MIINSMDWPNAKCNEEHIFPTITLSPTQVQVTQLQSNRPFAIPHYVTAISGPKLQSD
jgi:hypothetical protein